MSEYVKFSCEPLAGEIASFSGLAELNAYRRKLLDLGLIGVNPNGIGFGNLSVRDGATKNFYITGSATGGIPELLESSELVAPNDADALASKITETVLRPSYMTQLSDRNLRKATGFRAEILDARRKRFFEHIRMVTEQWLQQRPCADATPASC